MNNLKRLGIPVLLLALGHVSCTPGRNDTAQPVESFATSTAGATQRTAGRRAYDSYCAGCHGVAGDGQGEAAVFLHPKPRNFRTANFKFSSTRSGQLPTVDDLRRTIRRGLRGSAMPAWNLLPDSTIDALIAYIKTFSSKWASRGAPVKIPSIEDPYATAADRTQAIQRGEAIYHGFAACWSCHPAYISTEELNEHLVAMENARADPHRPRLNESEAKPSAEGEMIYPPDFLRDHVRAGTGVEDLYRSIAAGITGTAMPTWADSMEVAAAHGGPLVQPRDLWAVAYYVQSLIHQRPAKLTEGQFVVRDRAVPIFLHGQPATALTSATDAPAGKKEDLQELDLYEGE